MFLSTIGRPLTHSQPVHISSLSSQVINKSKFSTFGNQSLGFGKSTTNVLGFFHQNLFLAGFATKKISASNTKPKKGSPKKVPAKKTTSPKKTTAMKKTATKKTATKKATSQKRPILLAKLKERKAKLRSATLKIARNKREVEARKARKERQKQILANRRERIQAKKSVQRERRIELAARRKQREKLERESSRERQKIKTVRAKEMERKEAKKQDRIQDRKLSKKKPKRAAGAYGLFVKSQYSLLKQRDPSKTSPILFKEIAGKWKNLGDSEKKQFVDAAKEDRAKYLKARTQFNTEYPKKLTAFNFFMKDKFKGVKEKSPAAPLGEVSSQVSKLWKTASSEVKDKYQKMSDLASQKRKVFLEKLNREN